MLIASRPPDPDSEFFHCQQAAEKARKAFLFWNDAPFRKTHDLRELRGARAVLAPLGDLAERAEELTAFAWQFRHPGVQQELPPAEAEESLTLAREVFEAVLVRVPVEAHP